MADLISQCIIRRDGLEQEVCKYLKETPLRYLSDEAYLVQSILYGNLKYSPHYNASKKYLVTKKH